MHGNGNREPRHLGTHRSDFGSGIRPKGTYAVEGKTTVVMETGVRLRIERVALPYL